jgi:hypothetical protein
MNRRLAAGAAGLAVALPLLVVAAGPASAAPSTKGACVQAGIGTLKDLGALQAAAQKSIDYSDYVAVPDGTYLSLGQVVKLHTTTPDLFPWC